MSADNRGASDWCRTLEEVKAAIEQQRSWRAAVEGAKAGGTCGCLFVDARPLKTALLPVTSLALAGLRSILQARSVSGLHC